MVLWSPASIQSEWVADEAGVGKERGVLVALRIAECRPPIGFRQTHFEDLQDAHFSDDHPAWLNILRRIGQLTGHTGLDDYSGTVTAARAMFLDWAREHPDTPLAMRMRRLADDLLAPPRAPKAPRAASPLRGPTMASPPARAERSSVVDSALAAAIRGRAAAERSFPLELPGLEHWPNPNMVAIPLGRFRMGSPRNEKERFDDEGWIHEVVIARAFALGQNPVTFAEWDAALVAGAKLERPADRWGREAQPLINVSWDDANAYIAWLNSRLGITDLSLAWRLPSEAEWEYACRAGTTSRFSFGDELTDEEANFAAKIGRTTPGGKYPSNAFALNDMHGNVWEWCQDVWHDSYDGAPNDGSPWEDDESLRGVDGAPRVVRGGSWDHNPQLCRSATRVGCGPTNRLNDFGFRLARTLSPPTS